MYSIGARKKTPTNLLNESCNLFSTYFEKCGKCIMNEKDSSYCLKEIIYFGVKSFLVMCTFYSHYNLNK